MQPRKTGLAINEQRCASIATIQLKTVTAMVNGSTVRHLLRAAQDVGVSAADLGAEDLVRSEMRFQDRVDERRVLALWERAVELGGRDLPGRAARSHPREQRSIALYACMNMPTVRDMLTQLVQYAPLITNCEHWSLESGSDGARLVAQASGQSGFGGLVQLEFHMLDMLYVGLSSELLRSHIEGVSFSHACPALAYSDAFGAPVTECAPETSLRFAQEILDLEIPDANPGLSVVLHGQLEDMLAKSRSAVSTVDRLEAWIARQLPNETALEHAARGLAVSTRTLQRRLAEGGLSFRDVVDRVRSRLARQWLPSVDIGNVAERLGYSDERAMRRAFRRWTGTSPRRWLEQAARERSVV